MPSLSAVDRVFISHLHGDHVFGLLGLIASRAAWFLSHAQTTLHVYGPPGIAAFLASAVGISVPTRVVVHELLTPADKPTASSGRGAPQRHHLYVPQHQGGSRQKDGITVNPVYPDPDGKVCTRGVVFGARHVFTCVSPVLCFGFLWGCFCHEIFHRPVSHTRHPLCAVDGVRRRPLRSHGGAHRPHRAVFWVRGAGSRDAGHIQRGRRHRVGAVPGQRIRGAQVRQNSRDQQWHRHSAQRRVGPAHARPQSSHPRRHVQPVEHGVVGTRR